MGMGLVLGWDGSSPVSYIHKFLCPYDDSQEALCFAPAHLSVCLSCLKKFL